MLHFILSEASMDKTTEPQKEVEDVVSLKLLLRRHVQQAHSIRTEASMNKTTRPQEEIDVGKRLKNLEVLIKKSEDSSDHYEREYAEIAKQLWLKSVKILNYKSAVLQLEAKKKVEEAKVMFEQVVGKILECGKNEQAVRF